jgi:DNA-binding CsgD family transcriptional regulator
MLNKKTNKELARELGCTPRQVSKSRKRGYILLNGKKKKYKAPLAVQFYILKNKRVYS